DFNRQPVWKCGDEVGICKQRDGIAPGMRRNLEAGVEGHVTNPETLADPPGTAAVGLHDVEGACSDQLAETLRAEVVLPCREPDANARPQRDVCVELFRSERL